MPSPSSTQTSVVHGSGNIEDAVAIEISNSQMSGIIVRRRVIAEGDAVRKRNQVSERSLSIAKRNSAIFDQIQFSVMVHIYQECVIAERSQAQIVSWLEPSRFNAKQDADICVIAGRAVGHHKVSDAVSVQVS